MTADSNESERQEGSKQSSTSSKTSLVSTKDGTAIKTADLFTQMQHLCLSDRETTRKKDIKGCSAELSCDSRPLVLLCDLGYGVPKEARPRKEKLLAIARQLVNFLNWQYESYTYHGSSSLGIALAEVVLVDCPDASIEMALMERMKELWKQTHSETVTFPCNLSFSRQSLQEFAQTRCQNHEGSNQSSLVYLSPDADCVLDTAACPPRMVVVGMLIDRRIQVNRSRCRSSNLGIPNARWPSLPGLDPNEPFNVDCILEGMQQWQWNHQLIMNQNEKSDGSAFEKAALQAWMHHQSRHPLRPKHKK